MSRDSRRGFGDGAPFLFFGGGVAHVVIVFSEAGAEILRFTKDDNTARVALREVLSFDFKEAGDDGGGLFPVLRFGLEGFAASLGEGVEAGAAIVFGGAPFGFDGAFLFEFEENGVERALIDGEEIAADLLDAAGEAVAVERAEDVESFEDHEGEGALEDIGFFVGGCHFGFQQEFGRVPFGKQQGSFLPESRGAG